MYQLRKSTVALAESTVKTKRYALLSLLFQLALIVSTEPAHAEVVRIAYSAISGAMAPLWIAHDDGLFQRQGIQAQLLYIGGGSVVTQALLGGDVQFVRLGANAVVQASLRGAGLKMVANTINTLVFSLMSRPEILSPKDLKGRRSGSHVSAARRILLWSWR